MDFAQSVKNRHVCTCWELKGQEFFNPTDSAELRFFNYVLGFFFGRSPSIIMTILHNFSQNLKFY